MGIILDTYLDENIYSNDFMVKPIKISKPKNPKYVYIILTNTKTFVGKAIKFVTNTEYNHACISLQPDLKHVYGIGRRFYPDGSYIKILGREDLSKGIYKTNNADYIQLRFPITEEQYKNLKKELNKALKEYDKYTFDSVGLVRSGVFNIKSNNPYKVFCSGLVAELLNNAGIYLFDKHFSLVRPNDFFVHPDVEIVSKGKLKTYFNTKKNK